MARILGWWLFLWEPIVKVVDWVGRIDITSQILGSHDQIPAMINYLLHPPEWFTLPSFIVGLALLFFDSRRRKAAPVIVPEIIEQPIVQHVWLSPKDAFYKFSDREWILELQRQSERIQLAWLKKEEARRKLEQLRSVHYAKYKHAGPMSVPPPDGEDEAKDKLDLAFNEYTVSVNAEKFLRGEIVKALCKNLEDGVLQARGIAPHMMQVAQEIPSVQWTILSIDIEKAEAHAENLSYVGIRISKA